MQAGVDYIGVTTPFYCHDGNGNLLLHKRSCNCRDEQGAWDVGGGQLEFGQTLEDSVLREVREEYGCEGIIDEKMPVFSTLREWGGRRTHWLAVPFIIKINPEEVKINEPDKIDELGWFTLNNLPQPLHPCVVSEVELLKKYFSKYFTC